MRISLDFELNDERIYKDKNKILASWIKHYMGKYDENMYFSLYNSGSVEKDYTFSVYMGQDVVFEREMIYVPTKKMRLHFSCYDLQEGIHFYNIFTRAIGEKYKYKDIHLVAKRMNVEREKVFKNEEAYFKTSSPIIVREHISRDNSKTYYHDISTEKGIEVLLMNLKSRLKKKFGEKIKYDIDCIQIDILKNRMVTVRHNSINIPSNLCTIKISTKPYILDYIYKSGIISSFNASGYGMLLSVS
ncbi:CRISPR-associated endoribonuclease Cas6 [Peptoniphilus mikwangii]|uniref:CRISPR-associated endoribonuclease Cas6 n=1 Tax=Peptoniphilus mikwangii TaxID=1354300 RepID=UPI0004166EE2|nr:CRISPR-associated endoribonuclease Cas6 [Peptoniphilus mikwangii]